MERHRFEQGSNIQWESYKWNGSEVAICYARYLFLPNSNTDSCNWSKM